MVLSERREALERLAQALLQEEVLERDQVLAIIAGTQPAQRGAGGKESPEDKPTVGVEH
jgi:hypothetical protein